MNTNTVAQSDYAANAYTENVQQTTKKSAVTNGKTIGDPQLSEKAQKYYEQLKKKLTEESMAGITTQMISSLGLSEENMQAFQELMVNLLKDSGNRNNGK